MPLSNSSARYVGAYLLMALTALVGLGCWLGAREALLVLMRAVSRNWYAVGAVDRFGFIVLGAVWLVLVYLTAHRYHKAVPLRRVWRTFGRATAIQAGLLALEAAVYLISAQVLISRLAGS